MRIEHILGRLICYSESMCWSSCYSQVRFVVFNVQRMPTQHFQPHVYIGHCHHQRSCRFQCAPSQSTRRSARTATVSIETRARHFVYIPPAHLRSDTHQLARSTAQKQPSCKSTRTPTSSNPQLSRCGRSLLPSFSSATSLALGYFLGM